MYFSWFLSVAGLRNIQGPPSDSKKDLDMQCTGDFHLYSGVDMSKSSLHRESTDSLKHTCRCSLLNKDTNITLVRIIVTENLPRISG